LSAGKAGGALQQLGNPDCPVIFGDGRARFSSAARRLLTD